MELANYLADLCFYAQEINEGGDAESFETVSKIIARFALENTSSNKEFDVISWAIATVLSSGYLPKQLWLVTITDLLKILTDLKSEDQLC